MTCKECLCKDVCFYIHNAEDVIAEINPLACKDFKPKSRFVELPCEVGQTVYTINKKAICGHWEDNRWIVDKWDEWKVCEIPFSLTLFECGNGTYYLSREEAEKALAERSK